MGDNIPAPPGRRIARRLAKSTGDWRAAGLDGPDCAACDAAWGERHEQWCPVRQRRAAAMPRHQAADMPAWPLLALLAALFLGSALFLMWCGDIRL